MSCLPVSGYQHKRTDLATTFKISDIRKCPCCQEDGERLPGFFNAGECRLLLKQERVSNFTTLTCFTCLARGRLGQICTLDISPPEVYPSGIHLLSNQSRELAHDLLLALQIEADVICCQSTTNPEHETRRASLYDLDQAFFVACFVSDKYFQSERCIIEMQTALQSNKRILVFLVPESGATRQLSMLYDCVWNGSTGTDYWVHASKLYGTESRLAPQNFLNLASLRGL